MRIYPNSNPVQRDGSTALTLQHEQVHALQDQAGQMGSGDKVPGYADIAAAIRPTVAGHLPTEAPADAIAYDPRFTPLLSRSQADAYSQAAIAQSPASIQPGLQTLYNESRVDTAKTRQDDNDATLAQKAATK
jgi:hypothetical protein